MIKTGLTSITFRKLSPNEIVGLAKEANLSGIEWGGDIHVPHGDVNTAKKVRKITQDAGLEIPSYGSYYRTGVKSGNNPCFADVLKSAVGLSAKEIRVWAGNKGLNQADTEDWKEVIEDSRKVADMAGKEGIRVAFEYHRNTFTESAEAADRLIREIAHKNIYSYWQPPCGIEEDDVISGLKRISPVLTNVHVFNWPQENLRRPIKEGRERWLRYLEIISQLGGQRYALLEFVMDDDTNQFMDDAAVLNEIVRAVNI